MVELTLASFVIIIISITLLHVIMIELD